MDPSKGDAKVDLSQWSIRSNATAAALHASIATAVAASNGTVPLSFSLTSLPSSGTLRDAKGAIAKTPSPISGSTLWYTPVPCCTASTCTPAQVQQQQDTNNHTSFAYLSSDVNSKAPLTVSLAVSCPSVSFLPQAAKGGHLTLYHLSLHHLTLSNYLLIPPHLPDIGVPIAIAIGVFVVVVGSIFGVRQVHCPALRFVFSLLSSALSRGTLS